MAQQRNQFNIGESNKTSVKVHHGPGGQSNWSLGWGESNTNQVEQKANCNIYIMQIWSTTTRAKSYLARSAKPRKIRSNAWKRKKERRRKNWTANFPAMTLKTEPRLTSSLAMRRLTTARKTKSLLLWRWRLLQGESLAFNLVDSVYSHQIQIFNKQFQAHFNKLGHFSQIFIKP